MKRFLHFIILLLCFSNANAQLNMELGSQIDYPVRLNDVWGWHDGNGNEYAITGLQNGVSIVDVTDPYNAQEVVRIPGISSTWRDIKSWKDHVYVSNEEGEGVMVIDMSQLPSAAPSFNWEPNIPGLGQLSTIHNLFVDENGVLYLSGSNLNGGGAIYVDVDTDPSDPQVIGWGPGVYNHDIYTRGDTMYASEIYRGDLAIYDISNKMSANELGRQRTPFSFTHNAWLSDNGKVVFTTDERGNASVAAYDISDMDDIKLLDEYRPLTSLNSNTIPHNVHTWNDYLIISYYTDGGRVVDASRPSNLIEVGNFDSFFGANGGSGGVWGAYPFLPSRTVLLSDRQNGLVVTIPTYKRACWLEGTVTEKGTGNLLNDVTVEISSTQANQTTTGSDGRYQTGQVLNGDFTVTFQKAGYRSKAVPVTLENGVLTELDVELELLQIVDITGIVLDLDTGNPIPNVRVTLSDFFSTFEAVSGNDGTFEIENILEGEYDLISGSWGYKYADFKVDVIAGASIEVELERGYEDDFIFNYSWIEFALPTVTSGQWERAIPIGTTLMNGTPAAPGSDLPDDLGDLCYVTGAGGGAAGDDDVDGASALLTSPPFNVLDYNLPRLKFSYWFVNAEGTGALNDRLSVVLFNGADTAQLATITQSQGAWIELDFDIKNRIALTSDMRLVFEVADNTPGHVVEAAIDGFEIYEADMDGDGYGLDDCNDQNGAINPGATEIVNNNIDEDCDGVAQMIDDDMDGFNSDEDCDDQNASINPSAAEIANNNIDENCDGIILIIDDDMDGFNSDEDCDDQNGSINPNATEIANNNIDEDCDGIALIIDDDMDGFNSDEDCDDQNASINPSAAEIANNNIDENCDGIILIIDDDMDGFNSDEDCDDSNGSINPNATEIANNNIDEDCDGIALIIDDDMDGFNSDEDCDDTNASVNPNATEIANNNIDENCDGIILIIDEDMDGFNSDEDCDDQNASINPGAMEIPNNNVDENCDGIFMVVDNDMDGFNSDEDCDDTNASINPDATEIANNNIDENCDGLFLIIDDDMDGFNSDEDCDDQNVSINPNATEIANNNIDEDCDGVALIIDDDMDGFNSDEDCDDTNASINPNATEIANNNIDENCDGIILIIDEDMDGFNSDEDCDDQNASINPNATEIANNNIDEDCDGVALIIDEDMDGFNSDEDCDDTNASINPNATEIANNNIDEDCDGVALIIDDDMDGFNSDEDCDDTNASVNPGATEIPNNSVDEDCDGVALIIDDDMDGFNSDEDCDDTNASVNPDAMEIPNNSIDEDCDGVALIIDDDMDGFNSDEDCDDTNASVNPDAMEIPNNSVDEDCDGVALIIDDDMDGFNSDEDCDDTNASVNPDAMEIPNNSVDEDCDGVALIIDDDMDGFNSDEDCDDTNASVNPDAMEIPNNSVDEDCDGVALIIDDDMDGFNSDEDCDDTNPDINPDAMEIPNNGIDEDCDGFDIVSSTSDLISFNKMKVNPNPFINSFTIKLDYQGALSLKIIDLAGNLILEQKLSDFNQEEKISMTNIASGIYLLQVVPEGQEKIFMKRLMKME